MLLVSPQQIDESAARFDKPSIAKKDDSAAISPTERESILPEKAASDLKLTVDENLAKRRDMLTTLGQEPVNFAFERAIGDNDSVYSNFCEFIMLAKRKVGRIVIKDGNLNTGYATGFMVSERLLLTNWHVFNAREDVLNSVVEFFYELDVLGNPNPSGPAIFNLAPNVFFHSEQKLDYCLVAVEPTDITGKISLTSIGYHFLDPTLGKLGEEGKEKLNIIHHPDGDYKQLSIRENTFTKILENTIWYKTDTAPGSSGSPVYNDQWQVVALHHMGVAKMTPDRKTYLDKDDKPIPLTDGKVDAAKVVWEANEGIRISKVLDDVFSAFPADPLAQGLKKPNGPGTVPEGADVSVASPDKQNEEKPEDKTMDNNDTDSVRISFPASLIQANGNINVNINNRSRGEGVSGGPQIDLTRGAAAADFDEIKKIDTENAMDYSDCKGYDPNFLGIKIPIPTPKPGSLKFVAKLKTASGSILNYYYFSTIHHSVRKVPMISAINVDGNPDLRQDHLKRVDVWLRDNRLDYDMQLDDKFYASSGFDKGHMSRREDADYGSNEAEAKKRADLTCVYTNACPQVPGINRSNRSGLWGQLEEVVLEKGVEHETGKTSKISVFNGPIFDDANDRFFRSVQIPMAFFKIILWFNANKKLQATGFKLSQADLVGDIDFEKLDFDTNAKFQEYQCSIASLEKLTDLDFSAIKKYDTFSGGDPNESLRIESEEALRNMIDEKFTSSDKN